MKKIIITIVAIVVVISMCGCSATPQPKIMEAFSVSSFSLESEDLQDNALKEFIKKVETAANNKLGSSVSSLAGYYEPDDAVYLIYNYDIEKTYLEKAIEENDSLWTEVKDSITSECDAITAEAEKEGIDKNVGVFVTDKYDEPLLFVYNGETFIDEF